MSCLQYDLSAKNASASAIFPLAALCLSCSVPRCWEHAGAAPGKSHPLQSKSSFASTISNAMSASSRALFTESIMRSCSLYFGSMIPGVSEKITWYSPGLFRNALMRWRVVCTFDETIAIFSPINALSKVLLPALGLPNMFTNPAFEVIINN
jgi:hypothetical protein